MAVMGARLKRDISRRALGGSAGATQRLALGMRPTAGLGPTAPDDAPTLHQDATDGGIWPYGAEPAFGQRQGARHVARIGRGVMILRFRHPGRR